MGLGLGLLVAGVLFLLAVRFLAGLLSWVVRILVVLAALLFAVQALRRGLEGNGIPLSNPSAAGEAWRSREEAPERGGIAVEVTEVRIRRLAGQGRVRGSASVTFDDAFVVHDIRVVEGEHGLFIAMPSRRTPAGQYLDVAHPITASMRERIQGAVLAAFQAGEEAGEPREETA